MGVLTNEAEFRSSVEPQRFFKALAFDNVNLFPKFSPVAKSVDLLQGDGGAGTIKKITFKEGSAHNYAKLKTEAIDHDNLEYTYSLIEGGTLTDDFEKITNNDKFLEAPGGGTIIKTISKFYTKGDQPRGSTLDQKIKEHTDKNVYYFGILDKYLLANPNAYSD